MQVNALSTKNTNLMTDINDRFNRLSEGARKNLIKLAYQRDPDSLLDELLLGLWGLLIIATAFTVAFGAYYHYSIFQNAFGVGSLSVIGAFAVFIILEICKVFFGLHLARAILSMLWWKSLYRFLFIVGIAVIVFVAFKWSIGISTKGVAMVNKNIKSTQLYHESDFSPPPAIAEIDEKLSKLDDAKEAGAKSTWKGRTTQGGIDVIKSNTELQKELLQQRSLILTAAMARHDSLHSVMLSELQTTSNVLTDYGGKAEYATMILILLVPLLEIINYEKNKHKSQVVPLKK